MEEKIKIPDINGLVGTLLAIGGKVWTKGGFSPRNIIVCAENINVGKIKGEKFVARKHIDTGTKLFPGIFSYKLEEKEGGIVEFIPIEIFISADTENREGE